MLQPGERIGGRYVLERRLGLGGMGVALFAAMPPPRRRVLKAVAACAALLFLSLPVALLFAAPHRAQKFLQSAITGAPRPSHGAIRVTARPGEAEVYVDGAFRGMTPALVEVPFGNHSVRVGSVPLGRWRGMEVRVKNGIESTLSWISLGNVPRTPPSRCPAVALWDPRLPPESLDLPD